MLLTEQPDLIFLDWAVLGVLCMINNLVVQVHYGAHNSQPLATGKGVHSDVESGGQRSQVYKLRR